MAEVVAAYFETTSNQVGPVITTKRRQLLEASTESVDAESRLHSKFHCSLIPCWQKGTVKCNTSLPSQFHERQLLPGLLCKPPPLHSHRAPTLPVHNTTHAAILKAAIIWQPKLAHCRYSSQDRNLEEKPSSLRNCVIPCRVQGILLHTP